MCVIKCVQLNKGVEEKFKRKENTIKHISKCKLLYQRVRVKKCSLIYFDEFSVFILIFFCCRDIL